MNLKKLLLLMIGLCFASTVFGDEALENHVRQIADELRCPTCQAQSVKDSDAGLSLNMKQRIRELLKEGKSEEEILQFFEERYGEWILRAPKKEGFSLLLWVLPGLIIIITLLLLVQYLRKRSMVAAEIDTSPLSDAEKQQIENDLKKI